MPMTMYSSSVAVAVTMAVTVPRGVCATRLCGLYDCAQNVILRVQAWHPSLNKRCTFLLYANLHICESGAQQLSLKLRDSWGA
jgi:hypothetical protein